jgi:hypothetical protein
LRKLRVLYLFYFWVPHFDPEGKTLYACLNHKRSAYILAMSFATHAPLILPL